MTESKDWRVLKRIASEVAGELNEALDVMMFGKPGAKKPVAEILWDNKIGILRVLQAVALTHPEAQGNKDLGEPAASGLEEEVQLAAVKFANMILDAYWPDCNDIDGADIQSFGIKSGVMQEVPGGYDPEKHGESVYDAEPGDTWYVAHPGLLLLLQAQRVAQAAPTPPQPIKGNKTEALTDAATVQALEGL